MKIGAATARPAAFAPSGRGSIDLTAQLHLKRGRMMFLCSLLSSPSPSVALASPAKGIGVDTFRIGCTSTPHYSPVARRDTTLGHSRTTSADVSRPTASNRVA